jgi:hypothetical protein
MKHSRIETYKQRQQDREFFLRGLEFSDSMFTAWESGSPMGKLVGSFMALDVSV